VATYNNIYLTILHSLLDRHFNLAEIRTLCFNLNVDYESIPGEDKPSRIRELLLALGRHGRLPELITLAQEKLPDFLWLPVPDDFQLPESLASGDTVPPNQYHIYGDVVQGDKISVGNIEGSVVAIGKNSIAIQVVYRTNYYIEGARFYLPEFTTAVKNFFDNYLGDEANPVPFGGRDDALMKLEQWRTQADAPPRLLLAAPAGRGKSALLVQWSENLKEQQDVAVVFMPISIRFSTNQEEATFSLLATRLAHLYGKEMPDKWGNFPASAWRRLVAEYLQESLPDGRHLLLIVDGLDEAAWQQGADLFPHQLSERVRLVVSARYRGGEEPGPGPWLRQLGWDRFPQMAATLELETLTQAGVRDVLDKMGCPLDELGRIVDIVTELHRLSEGAPLLVALYVKDLWQRGEAATRLQPGDLRDIQPGYKGYFEKWWADQEELWGADDPLATALVNEVLHVLAMALGPLRISDLRQLLRDQVHSRNLKRAIRPLNRFVIGDGQEQGYAFAHPKLGEYFRDELAAEEQAAWQARFLAWGERTIDDLQAGQVQPYDVSRYLMLYYGRHLEKANADIEKMLPLVTWEWMQVWHEETSTYGGFLQDVNRVQARLRVANEMAAKQEQEVPYIGQEVLCALCYASVNSLSSNLSPHLPALLVRDRIWNPRQAVSHVLRIANVAQRTRALVTLLTVEESEQAFSLPENQNLRNVIISSGLRNMELLWQQNKTDEAELYHLQLAISPFLSATHVDEALLLAGKVQRSVWQARLLAKLLPLIEDDVRQIHTIKKIIHACSKIDESLYSEDIPFIIPTFTTVAQNLSTERLTIAFAEVWEEESQVINNQELAIDQAKDDPSMDEWDLRRLHNRRKEHIESRRRKKYILDYLAWHIEKHQATAFVELLLEYDPLPQVAEKIGRFARRLDDEIAYDIAIRLEKEFASAPQEKRRVYGMAWHGYIVEGVGMAFITLALSRNGEHQQKILQIAGNYIQTYGAKDFPYGEQDLQLLYQMAAGQLTDAEAADLVYQGKFMQRFPTVSI
jgi:hypothetical protein